jgi:NitT/TauT family transport system ATP-binding protein
VRTSGNLPAIQADGVGVRFGRQEILQELHLECRVGEFVAVAGPSGCGKSTLLRLVAGLLQPSSGQIRLEAEQESERAAIGYVFQDATLLPWRDVLGNITLPLELGGMRAALAHDLATRARRLVGLAAEDERKLPRMLSGGMRMRVSLARALVKDPDVLLLDEPFAAVDDILRQQLNEKLLELWIEHGWTTLLVTHNVAEAVFLSQRVLVMASRPGRIVDEIRVPFAYPRRPELRASPEFARTVGLVSQSLRHVAGG